MKKIAESIIDLLIVIYAITTKQYQNALTGVICSRLLFSLVDYVKIKLVKQ